MSVPEFSDDWTSRNIPAWRDMLAPRRTTIHHVLEIGSWEGRSALFWLEQLPNAHLTCIDSWDPELAPEIDGLKFTPDRVVRAENAFTKNVMWDHGHRVVKLRAHSVPGITKLQAEGKRFDLIHHDASHAAPDVLADLMLAWPMLRKGGVLAVDDYRWDRAPNVATHCGWGIQQFLAMVDHQVISDTYQMIVEKA